MPQLSPLSLTLPKNTVLEIAQDKSIRAPKSFLACLKHEAWSDTKKTIDALLEKNLYATHPPQHYWYRINNEMGVFEGFLTGVELDENQATISTHEEVLPERVSLFSNYLTEINRQAEPLLLVHESPDFSQQLKAKICHRTPDFHFQLEQEHHQLWMIPRGRTRFFRKLFKAYHSISSGRRASSPSEYTAMGSTARANWGGPFVCVGQRPIGK